MIVRILAAAIMLVSSAAAVTVDSLLSGRIAASPLSLTQVVITFDHAPTNSDILMLRALGITGGYRLQELPIVLTAINKSQYEVLKNRSGVVSLYANRNFRTLNNESRTFIGVENLMRDPEVNGFNHSIPVSGKDIGIAYIDTGIDATHPDLQLGQNVVQNVLFPAAELPLNLPPDFVPMLFLEGQPVTDVEGGHGTFGAGVTAGTGAASAGFYRGVAPGAKLIGLTAGNDVGLSTFSILHAMEYTLANQFRYNVRVCNNSYGTTLQDLPYSKDDPVNVATRMMHDRNIAVVFAAGNDGDAPDMINPFSVAPWVISVAAGEKRGLGTPAGFSSRGNDNGTGTDTPGQPADPDALPNLRPDITGSGVDIKSTRSKGPGVTNTAGSIPVFVGANDLSTIPPAFLPYYTTSQGTSFSTPQVSGVIALMLEVNPLLTPDEIVTVLRSTANPMPFEERVVGAGYLDAHNAVRAAVGYHAVPHPSDLFPSDDPNAPQITDASDDQLGTTAQDIIYGHFAFDAVRDQIRYTLRVVDLSATTPNMRWTMTSSFGETEIFVTASVEETGTTYEYGKITVLATGTRNQETLGSADAGSISGDTIEVRLSRQKINEAVGFDVLGTSSTGTKANSQIMIGSSLTGGLLLNSDSANGSDFEVRDESDPDPTPTPTPTPTPSPTPETGGDNPNRGGRFDERYSGTVSPADRTFDVEFELRRSLLDAQISQNHGNQPLIFELLDCDGNPVAAATQKKIKISGLAEGTYIYRVRGDVSKAVDFTIKSGQQD